jgi:NADP-dependent 3-hydroxy acid dehydrogenase YdfG
MICNAGVMPLSHLDALLFDQWDHMVDVNVRGLLYSIAAALPLLSTARARAFRDDDINRQSSGGTDERGIQCHQVRDEGDH